MMHPFEAIMRYFCHARPYAHRILLEWMMCDKWLFAWARFWRFAQLEFEAELCAQMNEIPEKIFIPKGPGMVVL